MDNYKHIGVWLDCKFSFQTHIKHLQSKIKSRIGFLFHNTSFPHAAKHTLVKLTILSIIDFGDVIYKIAPNTLLSKLDLVYHSAIHFITKAWNGERSCTAIFTSLQTCLIRFKSGLWLGHSMIFIDFMNIKTRLHRPEATPALSWLCA